MAANRAGWRYARYHGDGDELAPITEVAAMHEALEAIGGESELVALPGRDHFIADVFDRDELYAWLLQHRRGNTRQP